MHENTHTHKNTCKHTNIDTNKHTHVSTKRHTQIHICTQTHVIITHKRSHTFTRRQTHTHTYINTHIQKHTHSETHSQTMPATKADNLSNDRWLRNRTPEKTNPNWPTPLNHEAHIHRSPENPIIYLAWQQIPKKHKPGMQTNEKPNETKKRKITKKRNIQIQKKNTKINQ